MDELLQFLSELKLNNNREWFNNNKQKYVQVKTFAENLCTRLLDVISGFDKRAAVLDVKDCTYRIYRDVRFSADKSPYKTHIGIFINPPRGKKSMTAGYYLHLEPDNCFVCGGTIGLPSNVVKAIRMSIFTETDRYVGIVEDSGFKHLYTEIGSNLLKTAPKGFPKDWSLIDYIRPKDYVCVAKLNNEFVCSDNLPERLLPYLKQAGRYIGFLNETIEDYV